MIWLKNIKKDKFFLNAAARTFQAVRNAEEERRLTKMKRKVKLTELSKMILVSLLLLILFIGFLLIADERNQKIENGEIIQISESYRN